MSNLSLANPGTSLNFDGQALQNQQEDDLRREDEQQEQELRLLITNAFDDLIDEDDILSITSEEGGDSRNVSLVDRASRESLARMQEGRIEEHPENDWAGNMFSAPTSTPMVQGNAPPLESPRFDCPQPMSRTQEFKPAAFADVRRSVDSLRSVRENRDIDPDLRSVPSIHGSRDHLDSDYHSNENFNSGARGDFQGNVYPLEAHNDLVNQGQKEGNHADQGYHGNHEPQVPDHQANRDMILAQRRELIRKSIEDLHKMQLETYGAQQNQQYYHDNGTQEGEGHPMMNHNQPVYAEQPFDQNIPANNGLPHQGQGQGDQYNAHYQNHHHHHQPHHHHFRNIYEGRPYHTIGEREETEGGNIVGEDQYYPVPEGHMPGFYRDTLQQQGEPRAGNYHGTEFSAAYSNQSDRGFFTHTGMADTQTVLSHSHANTDIHQSHQGHPNEPTIDYHQGHPNEPTMDYHQGQPNEPGKRRNQGKQNSREQEAAMLFSPRESVEYPDGYRVNYQKEEVEKSQSEQPEKPRSRKMVHRKQKQREENLEADFMQQDGTAEGQQLAQLQILYKARGRKIEELQQELETKKQESGREMRSLKHHLTMAKGEKEGLAQSLEGCQELLQESKTENAQLVGRVHATESQLEGMKKGKEDLIKKLQTAESTIETLHQHLDELGSSESLGRARHEHDVVVSGLQSKYETEIKVLKEKIERQLDTIREKDADIEILRRNLSDSLTSAEQLQVTRAETINRLTQSLEESQKRCRNLLESSSAQDISQMKIQLQQAIASRTISDEMCASLQDEVHELKEQLQMLESASSLGVLSQGQTTASFQGHDDSLVDLGIKKTLDFDTPHSAPTLSRTAQTNGSRDLVSDLKEELERCLISNKQKRNEVTELKDNLKTAQKDLTEFKQRCNRAELQSREQQKKVDELESLVRPGDHTNAIENRLKKDIENLKREKHILLEDVEELKKRLEEVGRNEERLTQLNRDLGKQISDMVKEYDQDKRQALERVQRACDQVSQTSREQLRQELTLEFDMERSNIISRYEKECKELKAELGAAEEELTRVKEMYVTVCAEKDNLKVELDKDWEVRLKTEIDQIQEGLKKEQDLCVLRAEEEIERKYEADIDKLREEFKKERVEELRKLETELKTEREKELCQLQEKIEKERANEKAKFEQEKYAEVSEIRREKEEELEKIKKEKEVEVERLKEMIGKEKEEGIEIVKVKIEKQKEEEMQRLVEKIRKERDEAIEKVKEDLGKEKEDVIQTVTEKIEKEKELEIQKLKDDVEKKTQEALQRLTENLQKEKENEIQRMAETMEKEKEEVEKLKERMLKEKEEELHRVRLEREMEVRRVQADVTEKDEILRAQVREELKKEMEEDVKMALETKVAMSKVGWLEEHKATRQVAINNAVRLAEAELKMKMEAEVEAKLEQRLKEAKLLWQGESFKTLEDQKSSWEVLKAEEVATKLASEHEHWRQTEMQTEIESEKQRWAKEVEQRMTSENESWRQVELEAEKLRWMNEWEEKTKAEKECWVKNELEPAKRKWKLELEERLRVEKDNWRCMELETEKLKLMQEMEERTQKERKTWLTRDLPEEIEREKKRWVKDIEQVVSCERDAWRSQELSAELEKEKQKWLSEMEERVSAERETWRSQALSGEVEKQKEAWRKGVEEEMEKRLQSKLQEKAEKMEKENESKLLEAIEEHQEACKAELQETVSEERNRLKHRFDTELQERFTAEKKVWKEMVEQELQEKLEIEREKWKQKSDMELGNLLEKEKQVWNKKWETELVKCVEKERAEVRSKVEKEFAEKLGEEREQLKAKLAQSEESLESEKMKFGDSLSEEFRNRLDAEVEKMRTQLQAEARQSLETEREVWNVRHEKELTRKLEQEEQNWRRKFEQELNKKLAREEEQWKEMIQKDLDSRLQQEREMWAKMSATDWGNQLEEEKGRWEERKQEEIEAAVRKSEEGLKADWEEDYSMRLEQEVERAVLEAREDWHREYSMEMSINTSSAEASQSLLREEIDSLKQRVEELQAEHLKQAESWLHERQTIVSQKDAERRKALESLQDQNEAEYKQFLNENQDTLTQALKSARDQHTKEMAEMEERFRSEMKSLQAREKQLQQQLQDSMHSSRDQTDAMMASDKERIMWYEERDRLLQDIADRDSLLGKADVHLSKEVEKLRSELQAAYQRKLDTEMSSWKQKIELEYNRVSNAEQKEKLLLEKQLSEVNTELQKLKSQLVDDSNKHADEIKKLTTEMNQKVQKSSEIEKLMSDLKRAKALCLEFQSEASDHQQKCQRFKKESEEAQMKLTKVLQHQEKLHQELQKMKEEKTAMFESIQTMESAYRKDVAVYKQKQEDAALKMAKTDKILQDMRSRYRAELENLRKALEAENDVAMEAMKNKMVELQKKHVADMDALRKTYSAQQDVARVEHSQQKEGMSPPVRDQPDEDEEEETVLELRTQYLDTVTKIKDDVLRHITETNVRAAETVKNEMVKERTSTFQQIKDFYKENVRQILQNEVNGSSLENKLIAVEEALETLSSNPSSRCTTPRMEDFALDDRPVKSHSHDSYPRDAGSAPHSPRQVKFSARERSRTPVSVTRDVALNSSEHAGVSDSDPRSPKSRGMLVRSHSPRHVSASMRLSTERGLDDPNMGGAEVRTPRESGRSSERRSRQRSGDSKKGSRVMISSRDVHSGRYTQSDRHGRHAGSENVTFRAKSTTPLYSTSLSTSALHRPVSVPDLSCEEKDLKVWSTPKASDTYRYTPLRDTLRSGTNLHRSNSKSESDLSIAEKLESKYGLSEYSAGNLDLSTGSISSCDTFSSTGMRNHDAGEAPTGTPRRHFSRSKFLLKTGHTPEARSSSKSDTPDETISMATGERKEKRNMPLIQFRHGKIQSLPHRSGVGNSKTPQVTMGDSRKSPPVQNYRPLSVSANMPSSSNHQTDF